MLQFIRSKTYELAGGRRRLRDSPVLISGLISLEQEDTAGLLAGAAARLGRSRDPTREAAAPITCSSAAEPAARTHPGCSLAAPENAASAALASHPRSARGAQPRAAPRGGPGRPARPAPPSPPGTHGATAAQPGLAPASPTPGSRRGPRSLWEPAPAAGRPGRGRGARLPSRTWPRAWLRGRALVGVPRPLKDLF